MNHSEIVAFLWSTADLLRDYFKRGKYQDVILPLTVLRRLACVLAPTKEAVLRRNAELKKTDLENLDPQLRKASGYAFYNTSRYDFEKLLGDAPNLAANLRNYIAGFSPNMREVLEKFDFDNTISKLEESGLLFQVLERFRNVDLHPDRVGNPMMGAVLTVCDPCCGTGGMLTITKGHIQGDGAPGFNPTADIHLFGQEVNPETEVVPEIRTAC